MQPALLLWGWVADYPDPDNVLRVGVQHLVPGWRHETFDRLVEQAGRMTDPRQRLDLYQQADKILIEAAVLLPLTYGRYPLLVKPWVKQFVYVPHRRLFWQDVVIEPSPQRERAQPTVVPSPAAPPRTLKVALGESPSTLDPTSSSDTFSSDIIDQLFSGLVEVGPDLEILPDMAQRWEILDGGRKYIFHLRPDVYWTDGRRVTAADFEYAWKRVLDPAIGAPWASLLYDVKGARAFH